MNITEQPTPVHHLGLIEVTDELRTFLDEHGWEGPLIQAGTPAPPDAIEQQRTGRANRIADDETKRRARGRKPLEIGTYGKINFRWDDGKCAAYTNFRDTDGKTRQVQRCGETENKAERALKTALKNRSKFVRGGHILSSESTLLAGRAPYLEHVTRNCSATSRARYVSQLDNVILPEVGQLRYQEVSGEAGGIALLNDFMHGLVEDYAANTRRNIRSVLSGLCQTGVRHGALSWNPCDQLDEIRGGGKAPTAYTSGELLRFLDGIDSNKLAIDGDIPDLIRTLFCIATRIGEALALRWKDCNLTTEPMLATEGDQTVVIPPHSIWINGNIVHVTGQGLVRHSGKTFRACRVLSAPEVLVAMLLVRRPWDASPDDAVFPPPRGDLPWRYAQNVRRTLRTVREEIDYPDFHPHIGRATVATFLKSAGLTDLEIADYLGHARIETTRQHYFQRDSYNPKVGQLVGNVLLALGGSAAAA